MVSPVAIPLALGAAGAIGGLINPGKSEAEKRAELVNKAKNAYGYNQDVMNQIGNIGGAQQRSNDLNRLAAGSEQERLLLEGLRKASGVGGPSVAANQLRAQSNQALLSQQGALSSGGSNVGAAMAGASRGAAAGRSQLMNAAGAARAGEQLNMYGQFGSAVANQAASRNQLLQLEMEQALKQAGNELDRERIRASYMGQMMGIQAQSDPSALQAGLSAFSQGAATVAPWMKSDPRPAATPVAAPTQNTSAGNFYGSWGNY